MFHDMIESTNQMKHEHVRLQTTYIDDFIAKLGLITWG